jgi:Pvc16 N-terminal domain/Carboxypeptidase regulatory-like domain
MLDHLDNLLRQLLLDQVAGLTSEEQVRFQPPDEDWRSRVANLTVGGNPANSLNVYLFDVRSNLKLRTNELRERAQNGDVMIEPPPARVDCHYLITAWSPAAVTQLIEPTLDENLLLYQAMAALMNNVPLNASRIYPAGSAALAAVPEIIRDADLPVAVAPPDGFSKYAEFWGTMGAKHPWRPAVYLIVTLPVAARLEMAAPMVTTKITEYRQAGSPLTAETWTRIGGHALDATHPLPNGTPAPIAGAWVQLRTPADVPVQTTRTNERGQFIFDQVGSGPYKIRVSAEGVGVSQRDIDVKFGSGNYDVTFS